VGAGRVFAANRPLMYVCSVVLLPDAPSVYVAAGAAVIETWPTDGSSGVPRSTQFALFSGSQYPARTVSHHADCVMVSSKVCRSEIIVVAVGDFAFA